MSIKTCPYCAIKEHTKKIRITSEEEVVDGRCPDCGAFIDVGQHYVSVEGYEGIYHGALRLLSKMVTRFDNILSDCCIDLKDYYDEPIGISFTSTEIIDALFVPWSGGTTKCNFARAIGVDIHEHAFVLQEEEDEDE